MIHVAALTDRAEVEVGALNALMADAVHARLAAVAGDSVMHRALAVELDIFEDGLVAGEVDGDEGVLPVVR